MLIGFFVSVRPSPRNHNPSLPYRNEVFKDLTGICPIPCHIVPSLRLSPRQVLNLPTWGQDDQRYTDTLNQKERRIPSSPKGSKFPNQYSPV